MAAGDPAAAAAFVRRHQGRVYGLAVTIVGPGGLAEEVAQDAFVRCWRYGGGYDGRRGSVVSWMLAITRNAAIDALRSRTDQPIDPERLAGLLESPSAEPDVAEAARLRDALRHLPPEQARAVTLNNFYGLTAKEIAERDHLPLGTVKTRIRLGLARLRDRLEVGDE